MTFENDSVTIEGGLFFLSEHEWPEGRFPFVYLGNKTKYRLANNKLSIYHPGYSIWVEFEIKKNTDQVLLLTRNEFEFELRKVEDDTGNGKIDLASISASIYGTAYGLDYTVKLFEDNTLMYKNNLIDINEYLKFDLPAGYFKEVESRLEKINILDLDSAYYDPQINSEETIELKLDGHNFEKRIKIYGQPIDPGIELAVIPIIYVHHLLMYQSLTRRKFHK
ncbi:MAG: hypothetical protein MJA30_28015 [Cytophagales bacterium]|nr:hypothetical protein [Cytophagales bacterium]